MQGRGNIRASDEEREHTIELLRGHMLDGRLDSDELDERVDLAWKARTYGDLDAILADLPSEPEAAPPVADVPPTFVVRSAEKSAGSSALTLGSIGLGLLVLSFGVFSIVALPISVAAWITGRKARREDPTCGPALTGMVLGIVGSVLSLLVLAGVATVAGLF